MQTQTLLSEGLAIMIIVTVHDCSVWVNMVYDRHIVVRSFMFYDHH